MTKFERVAEKVIFLIAFILYFVGVYFAVLNRWETCRFFMELSVIVPLWCFVVFGVVKD